MGQGPFSRARISLFSSFLASAVFLCGSPAFQEVPLRLAGKAEFPWRQAFSWQQTQADDKVAGEDKIKSTIDTYFIIVNESLLRSELLDFGFLFDLNDVNAWNDYAYERGSMHVRVEVNKAMDTPLTSYTYKPKYFSINVNGASADVTMRGSADWIHKGSGGHVDLSPWAKHIFRLALMDGQWKIKRAQCPDVEHNVYPRDADFDKEAEEAVRELKRLKKHDPSVIRQRADLSGSRRGGIIDCSSDYVVGGTIARPC